MALASVVLPVYNGEAYIKEAVQSVLSQTFQNFILYVIDDGSADNTLAVLRGFADDRLQIIKNAKNERLIYTLNKGLQLCLADGCKYIIRMDADDICLPHRFERQVAFMEANPAIGLCGSWIEEFNENGTIKISQRAARHEQISSELFFQNTIWHPTVILRSNVVKEHNLHYEARYVHAEDYALWCRMAEVTKLANIQEVLLRYRVHGTNVSVLYSELQRQTCISISVINAEKLLAGQEVLINAEAKKKIINNYAGLLNQIPADASLVKKTEINSLQSLIHINRQAGFYDNAHFKKSMSDFILHYWSLWCRKYSVGLIKTLFSDAAFISKDWSLQRRLIILSKCLIGWRGRTQPVKAIDIS